MRRGITLLELTLVLVITGLVLAIALPGLQGVTDRLAVNRAALDIVTAHRRARITAILRSEVLVLVVGADSLAIRSRSATASLWRVPGPAATGVVLSGPTRQLTFSPVGITQGLSNATFALRRGTATRTVVVSRLGRLRLTP